MVEVPAVDGCRVCGGGELWQLRHRVTWHPEERKKKLLEQIRMGLFSQTEATGKAKIGLSLWGVK